MNESPSLLLNEVKKKRGGEQQQLVASSPTDRGPRVPPTRPTTVGR